MTPLVGKRLELCNANGEQHVLDATPSGTTWDSNGWWRVIRFDAGSTGCCVTFKVISPTSVSLVSRGERCTVFCQTTDQFHCVDPVRPEETNHFHGYYKQKRKNVFSLVGYNGQGVPLTKIDATTVPLTVTQWPGTIHNVREPSVHDDGDGTSGPRSGPLFPHSAISLKQAPVDITIPNARVALPTRLLTLQPDGKTLIYHRAPTENVGIYTYLAVAVYEKIRPDLVPDITPQNTGSLDDTASDDPERILRNLADLMIAQGNPQVSTWREDENYVGTPEAQGILDRVIRDGVAHTTPVAEVYPTQVAQYGLTILRTATYHKVAPPAKVTVSGCTGDYAAMNGEHHISSGQTTGQPSPTIAVPYMDYTDGNIAESSLYNDVAIFFDSSGFSQDANGKATLTGPCLVSVSYGPIDSSTEYREMVAAYGYWFYSAFRVAYHGRYSIYYQSGGLPIDSNVITTRPPVDTWEQVQAELTSGLQISTVLFTRNSGQASAFYGWESGSYVLSFIRSVFTTDETLDGSPKVTDINNRFGINPEQNLQNASAPYWYSIPRNNYITDVKIPFYRCQPTGNVKTSLDNIIAGIAYNGGNGCDFFEGVLFDYGVIPPPFHHFPSFHAPLNDSPFTGDGNYSSSLTQVQYELFANMFYVGRVNTAYTNGASIGYIRMFDTSQGDRFSLWSFGGFDRTNDEATSPVRRRIPYSQLMSTIMEYLVDTLAVEHVIIDNRANIGGGLSGPLSLREFFGDTNHVDVFDISKTSVVGNGNEPLLDARTLTYDIDFPERAEDTHTAFVEEVAALYPNANFQGGDVVFLTDSMALSAGDVHSNLYLGPNLDKDLGGSTTVRIIGDIDGQFSGGNSGAQYTAQGVENARLRFSDGSPANPLVIQYDGAGFEPVRSDGSGYNKRVPGLAVDCAPTLRGKAGGCPLPNDYETIVYPDLGHVTNTRARLPGDTRPTTPDPNNRDEWRDAWLEQAIDSVFTGPIFFETDTMATTSASTTVTVTTSAPHGLVNGNEVTITNVLLPIDGIPIDELNTQHTISNVGVSTFDITVTTPATATSAATGGTFAVRRRDVAARRRRREMPKRKKTRSTGKHSRSASENPYPCPTSVTLTPFSAMTPTDIIQAKKHRLGSGIDTEASDKFFSILSEELKNGGMCIDSTTMHLMATPTCQKVPQFHRN